MWFKPHDWGFWTKSISQDACELPCNVKADLHWCHFWVMEVNALYNQCLEYNFELFLLIKYTVQALCGFSKRSFMHECAYLYRSDGKCKIEGLHGLRRGLKCSEAQSHHFSSRVNERIFCASITVFYNYRGLNSMFCHFLRVLFSLPKLL